MLETLFPRRAANEFHGAPLAGWALAAMTLLTLVLALRERKV